MPSPAGKLVSIAAAQQSGNRGVELWAVDSSGQIWTDYQTSPGGPWTGWEGPGFKGQSISAWQVAAADQNNGNLMLFALDSEGWISSISQYAAGGDWTGWSSPGIAAQPLPFAKICAAQQSGGRGVELWAIDSEGQIWTLYQLTPGGAWSAWEGPGFKGQPKPMRRIAAADQGNGMLMLFSLDESGALWAISQYAAGGDWTGWSGPEFAGAGGPFKELAMVRGSGGSQLWATDANDSVWTIYQTPPGAGWSGWIGPGFGGETVGFSAIAAGGQNNGLPMLFGLQSGGQVWSLSGNSGGWNSWSAQPAPPGALPSGWEEAGTNSAQVLGVGNMLFSVDATSGNVSMYLGSAGQWTPAGGPAHAYDGTEDALFRITSDMSAVEQWDPRAQSWSAIGGPMSRLITARHRLHGLDAQGMGWMYTGTPGQWTAIGGPFRDLDANDDYCFAVAADGSSVAMAPCGTTQWTPIGGAMSQVYAAGNAVYGIDAQGTVSLYLGSGTQWSPIGGPFAQIAVWGVRLFALSADKTGVLEYRVDLGGYWQTIAGGADMIAAGAGYVAATSQGTILTHRLQQTEGSAAMSPRPSGNRQLRAESVAATPLGDPPTLQFDWLFQFWTADEAFAGYDGWVGFTMNGLDRYRLNRTHFERGVRYTMPFANKPNTGNVLTSLILQGEKHFLPDHWKLATITAWNFHTQTLYNFDVNADVPNELDRPGWLSLSPTTTTATQQHSGPTYVYIWSYRGFFDAVGHASMMLSDGTYISWWPEGEDRKSIPWVGLAFDAAHNPQQSYATDSRLEGTAPDLVLPIWNLDEQAVKNWWAPLDASSSRWNALSNNCSTTVFNALSVGGALQALTPAEQRDYCDNAPWTPNDVASLMLLLQSKHSA